MLTKFKGAVVARRRALGNYRLASYTLYYARTQSYKLFIPHLEEEVKAALSDLMFADMRLKVFKRYNEEEFEPPLLGKSHSAALTLAHHAAFSPRIKMRNGAIWAEVTK